MRRMNARQPFEVREMTIEQNPLSLLPGSCQVTLGKTVVLAVVETADSMDWWLDCPPYLHLTKEDYRIIEQVSDVIMRQTKLPGIRFGWQLLSYDGNLLTAATISMATALRLAGYTLNQPVLQSLPRWVALNAGLCQGQLYLDLDKQEEQQAEVVASLVLDGEQMALLNTTGNCTVEQFNELLAALSAQLAKLKDSLPTLQERMEDKMDCKEIIIATKNPAKAKEFKAMFEPEGYKVKTLLDYPDLPEVAETGKTFEENARLKADTISRLLNCPVLGDDSGLCVDALDGLPGIYSARYAGDHNNAANNAKLLSEMAGVPEFDRTAHYHTTLVFAAPGKEDLVVEGEVEGLIAPVPRGENGFGYDPLFYLPELDKTMAEITAEQKNKISHRAVATAKLKHQWRQWLEG